MPSTIVNNPCIICGKQRIVTGTSKEKYGDSMVIVEQTSCPDPDCQKKVVAKLQLERQKREDLNYDKQQLVRSKKQEK